MARVCVRWMTIGCLVALAPARAWSQWETTPEEGMTPGAPIVWNLGGTLNVPLGSTADRQYVGGGFAAGVTYNPTAVAGIQFEYGADWASLKTGRLQNAGIYGNTFFQYFNLNLIVRPGHPHGPVGFYLIAGGGLYYRSVDVTRVTGAATGIYCDPWLYFCSTGTVATTSLVGSRSSWNGGVDGGVGITFALSPMSRLYLEARYHYVWGPSFTDLNGNSHSLDGQFLPLTVGVRF
jgi:hypothetical protein